jgi:hypothetical protein
MLQFSSIYQAGRLVHTKLLTTTITSAAWLKLLPR